jgi:hypothetical protein
MVCSTVHIRYYELCNPRKKFYSLLKGYGRTNDNVAAAATCVSFTALLLGQPPGHRRNAPSYIMGLHGLEIPNVTHAVSRRLSLLNAREVYVGFMADKLAVGRFLSEYFRWNVYRRIQFH